MSITTIYLIGVLTSCAIYLILHRSLVKILFGFGLLGHTANLILLASSGNPNGKVAPIIDGVSNSFVDPIPQALFLTAIVIGFGVTAYLTALFYHIFQTEKSSHAEDIFPI